MPKRGVQIASQSAIACKRLVFSDLDMGFAGARNRHYLPAVETGCMRRIAPHADTHDALVKRTVYRSVPSTVEYELTDVGRSLGHAVECGSEPGALASPRGCVQKNQPIGAAQSSRKSGEGIVRCPALRSGCAITGLPPCHQHSRRWAARNRRCCPGHCSLPRFVRHDLGRCTSK